MQPRRNNRRRSEQELAPIRREVAGLFVEAESFFRVGDEAMARRRVRAARRAAMKVRLRIPEHADRYCRACDAYLVQGRNMTIRVKAGVRIRVCGVCGAVRRRMLGLSRAVERG